MVIPPKAQGELEGVAELLALDKIDKEVSQSMKDYEVAEDLGVARFHEARVVDEGIGLQAEVGAPGHHK